jgi:putative endonuclease
MAFVYILQDKISQKYYTGSCLEISKRIDRHKNHTGGRTTKIGDWQLICYRQCETIDEARKLEKLVKSYKGGNAFKKIIHGELAEWSKAPHC